MAILAINGGTPLRTTPYPAWPRYDESEKKALLEVLESQQWGTLGPAALSFEKEFAHYIGSTIALTVCNWTVSLEIILRALGIGPGYEVIIPPYTFIATATAVLMAGAATDYTEIMVLRETTRSWKAALILPALTVPQVLLLGWILNQAG